MEERREGGREGGEGVIFSIIPIIDKILFIKDHILLNINNS